MAGRDPFTQHNIQQVENQIMGRPHTWHTPAETPVEGEHLLPPSGGDGGLPPERSKFNKPPKVLPTGGTESALRPRGELSHEQQVEQGQQQREHWEGRIGNPNDPAASAGVDLQKEMGTRMTAKQIYSNLGWNDESHLTGPRSYDVPLPGISDPSAAPRPPRWEELSPAVQEKTHRSLAELGTSIEQMTQDIGRQLDAQYIAAHHNGTPGQPKGQDFYEPDSPERKRIIQSAHDLGIPPSIHAQMNAITSPNTKFFENPKSGPRAGQTTYPNDEAARHAVMHVQQGGSYQDIDNKPEWLPNSLVARPANVRKAAQAYEQYEQGLEPHEWRTGGTAKSPASNPAGPKTGPYANAQASDTTRQMAVADVHSGGGALPHLGTDKPPKHNAAGEPVFDKAGKPVRDKSEREYGIERTPFFHSGFDYAMRQAMAERGLSHTRNAQATQWWGERAERGLMGDAELYGRSAQATGGSRGASPLHSVDRHSNVFTDRYGNQKSIEDHRPKIAGEQELPF